MFKRVLVANRGEIALRIMRTLREMAIESVAVYSDVDREALHTCFADRAVCLGDPTPSQSYLNIGAIIAAAKATGAEAIHPGYGFLSENPDFAEQVVAAGLVFIGPSASAMRALGDKTAARKLMGARGVPVIPGMDDPESDPAILSERAQQIGYPVMLKAVAGGGGKGMRVVTRPEDLAEAAILASQEAQAAFGNGAIFLEKVLTRPRHIEIQILADAHGHTVHLFERECSIQRRHQKIIEETPSVAVDAELRKRMGDAAVKAAQAVGYVNAGTVEFLVDAQKNFYFLEVNTRLQVEHPITEAICGVDLVRLQLEVAAGKNLPWAQEDLVSRGHAIECRIYAEDPNNGFMPSPGRVLRAEAPMGPGVRYDSSLFSGLDVPVQYDPILSKLIVHAEDRSAAIARMRRALEECVVLGIKTPIEMLMDIMDSAPFHKGETHTGFLDEHFADWRPSSLPDHVIAIADALWQLQPPQTADAGLSKSVSTQSPWTSLGAWRLES